MILFYFDCILTTDALSLNYFLLLLLHEVPRFLLHCPKRHVDSKMYKESRHGESHNDTVTKENTLILTLDVLF